MKRLSNKGFTLIELMLVVIIIGVLAAMVIPRFVGRTQQARVARAEADINVNLATALDLYELDNGFYPTTDQGLDALRTSPTSLPVPPNWNGPYLKKRPVDPWGREFVYISPGIRNPGDYDLVSWGVDGMEGGDDDIINWEE